MKRILLLFALLSLAVCGQGKVRLPALVGNNMVLQQQAEVNLWGWASPSRHIEVRASWLTSPVTTDADSNGRWCVKVQTPKASLEKYRISISDGEIVELENVLIGEVWICSGQSNMGFRLEGQRGQPMERGLSAIVTSGRYADRIRVIDVDPQITKEPREDFNGQWAIPSAVTAPRFSAVAYFFAVNLTEALGVPVGIVHNSWGGSKIEAWMDEKTLSGIEGFDLGKARNNKQLHQIPANLYKSMLSPLFGFKARGFLWYQGEANIGTHRTYARMMTEMVALWRTCWGDRNQEMPFYCVQLAPHRYNDPNGTLCPLLVEAQLRALRDIPNSGMVPTGDIGNDYCIHPPQKAPVGLRLANLALVRTYKAASTPSTGPVYQSHIIEGNVVKIRFENARMGLIPRFEPVRGFEIAGKDRVFHPAEVRIDPNTPTLFVSSDAVTEPVAVRYAFHNYNDANLANTVGMPAFPFRTDTWDDVR